MKKGGFSWSCRALIGHVTPRHATARHGTPRQSHHVALRFVTPCHTTSHHVTPRHTTDVTPRHATARHVKPRHVTPRHTTLRHTTSHQATSTTVVVVVFEEGPLAKIQQLQPGNDFVTPISVPVGQVGERRGVFFFGIETFPVEQIRGRRDGAFLGLRVKG